MGLIAAWLRLVVPSKRLRECRTAGTLEWKSHKDSCAAPQACAAHTMTAVGRHGVYVFGGEGRKLSNAVHALDPETLAWSKVNTLGVSPTLCFTPHS